MLAQSRLLAMRKLSFSESGWLNQSCGTAAAGGRKSLAGKKRVNRQHSARLLTAVRWSFCVRGVCRGGGGVGWRWWWWCRSWVWRHGRQRGSVQGGGVIGWHRERSSVGWREQEERISWAGTGTLLLVREILIWILRFHACSVAFTNVDNMAAAAVNTRPGSHQPLIRRH